MTDKEVPKYSNLNDYYIFDPATFNEIADTIPTVSYIDGDLQVQEQSRDIEEDDLSGFVTHLTNDDIRLPSSHLQVPSSHSESDSVSLPSSFSPLTSFDIFPDVLFEDFDVEHEGTPTNPIKTVDERLNYIFSSALKEEIRFKIQLKRVTSGQEELKVDFTAPDTTICFDTVKKRNEVREKNKEYAKQSRDRVKFERKKHELDNKKLKHQNLKLKQEIMHLKQKMLTTNDFLHSHHKACSMCCRVEDTCSICTETNLPKLADLNKPRELVKTADGLTKTRDLSPQPGPSGLSKGKNYSSRSETVSKTGHVSADVHARRHGVHNFTVCTEAVPGRLNGRIHEGSTSNRDENETQDESYQDKILTLKRPADLSRSIVEFDEEKRSSEDHIWIEVGKDQDTLLTGKRRAVVSKPKEQFDEEIPLVTENVWGEDYILPHAYYLEALKEKLSAVLSKPKEQFQDKIPSVMYHTETEHIKDHNSAWIVQCPIVSSVNVSDHKDPVFDLNQPKTKDVKYQNTVYRVQHPTIVSTQKIPGHTQLAFSIDNTEREVVKDLDTEMVIKPRAIVSGPQLPGRENLVSSTDFTGPEDEKDLDTLFREKQYPFISNPVEQVHEDFEAWDSIEVMDILDHG